MWCRIGITMENSSWSSPAIDLSDDFEISRIPAHRNSKAELWKPLSERIVK